MLLYLYTLQAKREVSFFLSKGYELANGIVSADRPDISLDITGAIFLDVADGNNFGRYLWPTGSG